MFYNILLCVAWYGSIDHLCELHLTQKKLSTHVGFVWTESKRVVLWWGLDVNQEPWLSAGSSLMDPKTLNQALLTWSCFHVTYTSLWPKYTQFYIKNTFTQTTNFTTMISRHNWLLQLIYLSNFMKRNSVSRITT